MGRYGKRQLLHRGLDTLKAHIDSEASSESILYKLVSNSELVRDELIDFVLFPKISEKFENYIVGVSRDTGTHVFFLLLKPKNYSKPKTKVVKNNMGEYEEIVDEGTASYYRESIEITGQGLMEYSYEYILQLVSKYGIYLDKLVRFDVCVDVEYDVNKFHSHLSDFWAKKITNTFKSDMFGIESFYFGKRTKKSNGKKQNVRDLTRVYNKLLDSEVKHKIEKYKDKRGDVANVTRIEVEIRAEKAKNYDPYNLSEVVLRKIVQQKIEKLNVQFFSHIHDWEEVRERHYRSLNKGRGKAEIYQTNNSDAVASDKYTIAEVLGALRGYFRKCRTILSYNETLDHIVSYEEELSLESPRDTTCRKGNVLALTSQNRELKKKIRELKKEIYNIKRDRKKKQN